MASSSPYLHFHQFLAVRTEHVRRARQARVERVYGAQDFHRPLGIRQGRADERALIGPVLPFAVARRSIPGAGYHDLVVGDLAILYMYPVAQRAARRFRESVAFRLRLPGLSLIHISEPTRRTPISYAVFCLTKK